MKLAPLVFALIAGGLMSATGLAQNSGSVNEAFQVARTAVKPEIQTKVVSVYGIGTPSAIEKWYIIFFDPTVGTHGRAVLVENHKITKTYPANGGATYSAALTFDPSRISSEGPALSAAQGYATQHHIAYEGVRALLKQSDKTKPFRWKVELVKAGHSRGVVYVNALDDSVASYSAPSSSTPAKPHRSRHRKDDDQGFGNDVKNTFLSIGADLEEFFTGERTVDK